MSKHPASPPPVAPRNPAAMRMVLPGASSPPPYATPRGSKFSHDPILETAQAEREVEILNHCFEDMERFMAKLQQSAEAQNILIQRKAKKRKSQSGKGKEDNLLTLKACPPKEDEFVDIFQKIKYSFSLLARLKSSITNPNAEELLHHVFVPLDLMVKTTGGPALGAGVVSPALTGGAIALLEENLTVDERQLWTALGTNWTQSWSQVHGSSYTPIFLDGWTPAPFDPEGQLWEDPIELQHKQEYLKDRIRHSTRMSPEPADPVGEDTNHVDATVPEGDRMYVCSYDFVARNSSELSVLHGEKLEVIEASKRWWKCRNRYDQVGFVPSNILEPLSALGETYKDTVTFRQPKRSPHSQPEKYFSFTPGTWAEASELNHRPTRPYSQPADTDKVMMMNDELMGRLANGKSGSARPLFIRRTSDTSIPLNYQSPPSEVEAWLRGKGFSEPSVKSLGVLTGAQLLSLNKVELRSVSPEEGARIYSQIMVQKALLEDAHRATELQKVMEKQKMKVDQQPENSALPL